jgi:hypothetical protein
MTSIEQAETRGARRRRFFALAAGALAATLILPAALVPVTFDSREERFDIPNGTWARRRAGQDVEILPSEIRLVAGLRNVLVLRNLDDVPQVFGPTLLMPGQTFRLPFEEPSENLFTCTAHASGQMTVVVEEAPTTPWARIAWRARGLLRRVSGHDGASRH